MMENPMLRLQYYRETGQTQEAEQYEQYLKETGQWQEPRAAIPRPAAAQSDATRALPRERAGASGDWEAATAPGQMKTIGEEVVPALAAHLMNTAQGVPLVRELQSGLASASSKFTDNPMTFAESRQALDELTGEIPSDLRGAQKLIGGGVMAPLATGAASTVRRLAPIAKEVGKELMPRNIQRAGRVISRARKAMPQSSPVRGRITPAGGGSVRPGQTWLGFVKENMGPAMKEHGSHGEAMKALGARWKGRTISAAKEAPATLEGLLGNSMDNVAEARKVATLEERIGLPDVVKATQRYRTGSGRLQQGAPQARFEHFADRMAKRVAEREAGAVEPTLEDLLAASLEHIKQGGTLRQASDVASRVRR